MNYSKKKISAKIDQIDKSKNSFKTKSGLIIKKLLIFIILALVTAVVCFAAITINGIINEAPDISSVDVAPDGLATKLYDSEGNEMKILSTSGSNRILVDIEDIPADLCHAFVAIEDERFYQHNGIDIRGIIRAGFTALTSGDLSQGASTITQQLIKNNVLGGFNETTTEKIKRKIQEQYLAVKLEGIMSKDEILQDYLNTINLGGGYYGVQAAARGYLGKDVSELSLSECAVIAAITQNPSKLNPLRHPDDNKERAQSVLLKMLEQGYITTPQYSEAIADDVYSRIESHDVTNTDSPNSYFVDSVIEQLISDLQSKLGYSEEDATNLVYKGGLTVNTTQDTFIQETAEDIINTPSYYPAATKFTISYSLGVRDSEGNPHYYTHTTMRTWYKQTQNEPDFSLTFSDEATAKSFVDKYRDEMLGSGTIIYEDLSYTVQPQISFTLIDQYTGYIKAIVGGRGEKIGNRTLNRAIDSSSARQPGSAIKPLAVYSPAIDLKQATIATVLDDAPYAYSGEGGKQIQNNTKEFLGLMSVREAMARSENIPAVKLLTQITPQAGFNYLMNYGFTTLISQENAINGSHDVVQSLALGGMTKGVRNIDMAAAYATIANDGVYTTPVYYTTVYDNTGKLIIDNSVSPTRTVLKSSTAWLMTNGLMSVISSEYATGGAAALSNQPVAGKTGTTQVASDKWFCGYTPYYTAVIWSGYDDNSLSLPDDFSQVNIWHDIMEKVHANLPTKTFEEQPDDIIECKICKESGKLAIDGLCDADPRGSQVVTEYFSKDNLPSESCDVHVKVNICNDTGLVASAKCTNITAKIMIKKAASLTSGDTVTQDAPYAITQNELNTLCSGIHNGTQNNSITTQATTSSVNNPTAKKPN